MLIPSDILQAIRDFSCDHVLIPSDIPGHSKQSSTDVEQPTMFRNKQKLTSGNIKPCVSPRSSPHTTVGSLVFTLLFWTNHRQACPILAGKSLIGQCSHRSTKMAAVAEDCRRLRSFRVFLACLKLRNSEKKDC